MNATLRTFKPTPTFTVGALPTPAPTSRAQAAQALRLYRASRRFLVAKNGHEYAIGYWASNKGPFAILTTR